MQIRKNSFSKFHQTQISPTSISFLQQIRQVDEDAELATRNNCGLGVDFDTEAVKVAIVRDVRERKYNWAGASGHGKFGEMYSGIDIVFSWD